MGEDISGYSCTFGDVKAGTWYTDYVAWAAAKGIVNGYIAATFGPEDNITREQMMSLFVRFVAYKGIALEDQGHSTSFTGSASISGWARDAVQKAAAAGLVKGDVDGRLRPQGTATRAELATLFQRFTKAYVD